MPEKKNNETEDMDANITDEERAMLERNGEYGKGKLDSTDDDGIELNEESDGTGNDLDVPGSELDDENEDIGEEDEENNYYSESDNKD